MTGRLGEISGYRGLEIPTAAEYELGSRFGEDPTAYAAYLEPALRGVHPTFRRGVADYAQKIYDQFMTTQPGKSFLDYMAKRGGFFGGR